MRACTVRPLLARQPRPDFRRRRLGHQTVATPFDGLSCIRGRASGPPCGQPPRLRVIARARTYWGGLHARIATRCRPLAVANHPKKPALRTIDRGSAPVKSARAQTTATATATARTTPIIFRFCTTTDPSRLTAANQGLLLSRHCYERILGGKNNRVFAPLKCWPASKIAHNITAHRPFAPCRTRRSGPRRP